MSVNGDALKVGAQTFSSTGTSPSAVFALTGGTLTVTGNNHDLVDVNGGSLDLGERALLSSTNATVDIQSGSLFNMSDKGKLTGTGTGSTSLVQVNGGSLSVAKALVEIEAQSDKAELISPAAATGLVSLTGGTHFLATATNASMFELEGRGTQTTNETVTLKKSTTGTDDAGTVTVTLTRGTDTPLRGGTATTPAPFGRPLLETSGATIGSAANPTQRVVKLDAALLEASAPLLSYTNSTVWVSGDLAKLADKAKLTTASGFLPSDALIKLDKTTLNLKNTVCCIALIKLDGGTTGAFLNVAGHLLQLSNGSTIDINKGFLISLTGKAVLNITGALVKFFGTGNSITVTNGEAPTTTITVGGSAIPIRLAGSGANQALISQVFVGGTPVQLATGATGAINVTSGSSLIKLDGTEARINILGTVN